jgi:uncharacterized protein involved in tolerance to divalent cations
MTKLDEVLKLALECAERCESIDGMYSWSDTITAIKEALAQLEQKSLSKKADKAAVDAAWANYYYRDGS